MGFDPLLYVSLGAGIALGTCARPPRRALLAATQVTIVALLFFLGASLSALPSSDLAASIGLAFGFVGLLLGFTLLIGGLLPRPAPSAAPPVPSDPPPHVAFSLALVLSVVVGYATGLHLSIPAPTLIEYALYALLFLTGLGFKLAWHALKRLWVPLSAAIGGATAAGAVYAAVSGIGWASSFAISYGFGWYTLDGPLVTASVGASIGLVAFLANFLRENLTMLLAPVLGRRMGAEALTASGGATTMDTTLFFVVRYGDPEAGMLSLASGLVLTIAASLAVPAFLAFAR